MRLDTIELAAGAMRPPKPSVADAAKKQTRSGMNAITPKEDAIPIRPNTIRRVSDMPNFCFRSGSNRPGTRVDPSMKVASTWTLQQREIEKREMS